MIPFGNTPSPREKLEHWLEGGPGALRLAALFLLLWRQALGRAAAHLRLYQGGSRPGCERRLHHRRLSAGGRSAGHRAMHLLQGHARRRMEPFFRNNGGENSAVLGAG